MHIHIGHWSIRVSKDNFAAAIENNKKIVKTLLIGTPTKGMLLHQENAPAHKFVVAMVAVLVG